jgi:hypothetical protein
MDKATFLADLQAARAEWDQALAAIHPDRLEQPGAFGSWSAKALIAHVIWYEREVTRTMQQHALDASELWQLPADQRNAAIHARDAALPVADVLAAAQQSYQALRAALAALTEADFIDPGRYAGMPADWVPADIYAQNTFEHYREHLPALRALSAPLP